MTVSRFTVNSNVQHLSTICWSRWPWDRRAPRCRPFTRWYDMYTVVWNHIIADPGKSVMSVGHFPFGD